VFVDLMTGLNAVPNSASMARRAILRRVGGFSEDKALIAVEDYDLWLRVARHTERFHRVAETLGVYWDGGGGHNLSASEAQIATEVLVFARHRKDLTAEQDREAQRNWRLRHEAMRAPTVDDQARARLSRDEFGVR
jgi:GT2 family glycosyltransferase